MNDKPDIKEFRKQLSFPVQKSTSVVVYLKYFLERSYIIDWDVYLPSKQMNLQRGFVWTLQQKQELVISVLKGIKIPSISVIIKDSLTDPNVYQIIDGKQRLSSLLSYLKGEFPIVWEEKEYYFNDLGKTAQGELSLYTVLGDVAYEGPHDPISDQAKIDWFEMINFAGTPQDQEHLNKLKY